jgi:hypothetical protein
MLRRADNVSLTVRTAARGLFRKRTEFRGCSFHDGRRFHRLPWSEEEYRRVLREQQAIPIAVFTWGSRTYWHFHDKFFWENDDLSQDQVCALLLDRERQLARKIERATARAALGTSAVGADKRTPIPDDVKAFVWQRDNGRCVKCGSNERLEFDHIIPIAMGGSNTARNIQLLCETHNREKGGHLA